jgi:hypothetical protein
MASGPRFSFFVLYLALNCYIASTLVELFAQNQIGATFTNPSERDRVCANVRV